MDLPTLTSNTFYHQFSSCSSLEMIKGSLNALLNTQKMTFGFWAPKKSTTQIFPCFPTSLFIPSLNPHLLFVSTLRKPPKRWKTCYVNSKREKMLTVFCVLVEEERNRGTKRAGDNKRRIMNLWKRRVRDKGYVCSGQSSSQTLQLLN